MSDPLKSLAGVDQDGVFHHQISQPSEDVILERNKRVRNEKPLKDLSFGRQVATIPFVHLAWAEANGFDIHCQDNDIASKELFRFLTTTDKGRACMVQDHV